MISSITRNFWKRIPLELSSYPVDMRLTKCLCMFIMPAK